MKKLLIGVVVLLLAGCASLGLPSPKGFDQTLGQSYGIHTAVLQAVTVGVTSGDLSSSDAISINQIAINARVMLDSAKALQVAGDKAGAQSKLAMATSLLVQLQTYLNTHVSKK